MKFYIASIATILIMASRSVVGLTNSVGSKGRSIYYWFRLGDLRLNDNPALHRAADLCVKTESNLVPVFCFDPRLFGDDARGDFGSMKCGPRRAKFVIESVADLRNSLEKNGSKLLVSTEKPEVFFSEILKDAATKKSSKLVYQEEPCSEEQNVAKEVEKLFESSEAVWGSTVSSKTALFEFHILGIETDVSFFSSGRLLRCTICKICHTTLACRICQTLSRLFETRSKSSAKLRHHSLFRKGWELFLEMPASLQRQQRFQAFKIWAIHRIKSNMRIFKILEVLWNSKEGRQLPWRGWKTIFGTKICFVNILIPEMEWSVLTTLPRYAKKLIDYNEMCRCGKLHRSTHFLFAFYWIFLFIH